MHYYLYRITNKVNNKIYVGVHKTRNLDDGYMGSGKIIKAAILKHGAENFQKEILETFDDAASMYEREKQVVDKEFLAREDTYNLRRGGHGGFDYLNSVENPTHSVEHMTRMSRIMSSKYPKSPFFNRKHSDESKVLISKRRKENPTAGFAGKEHSIESKKKIGAANSKSQQGERNSQYGSLWITNGVINRKTKSEIPEGWVRGRIRA